jgi:hypothetical protein
MRNNKFFTKKQASEYLSQVLGLPVSEKTLSKYITVGGGPNFQKFGRRVVYQQQFLYEWATSRLSRPYSHSSAIGGENG